MFWKGVSCEFLPIAGDVQDGAVEFAEEYEEGETSAPLDDGSAGAQLAQLLSHGPVDVMECRHRLELYRLMCTQKDAGLLAKAAAVYGEMQPHLQKAFVGEVSAAVSAVYAAW